ncbi:MAG: hypothetical protein WDO73_25335 [Ignavibacteriota bacterium]
MMAFWEGRLPFAGHVIHWDFSRPLASPDAAKKLARTNNGGKGCLIGPITAAAVAAKYRRGANGALTARTTGNLPPWEKTYFARYGRECPFAPTDDDGGGKFRRRAA